MPVISIHRRERREWCGTSLELVSKSRHVSFHPFGETVEWRELVGCVERRRALKLGLVDPDDECGDRCLHRFRESGDHAIRVKLPIDAQLDLSRPWCDKPEPSRLLGLSIADRRRLGFEPGQVVWRRSPLRSQFGAVYLHGPDDVLRLANDPSCIEVQLVDVPVSATPRVDPPWEVEPKPSPATRPRPMPATITMPKPSPVGSVIETEFGLYRLGPGWSIWREMSLPDRGVVTFRGFDHCSSTTWKLVRDHPELFDWLGSWVAESTLSTPAPPPMPEPIPDQPIVEHTGQLAFIRF